MASIEVENFQASYKKIMAEWVKAIEPRLKEIKEITDELDKLVEKLKAQDINILEQTTISGGRRVCFFEGPDGVQLEFIEMKS